MQKNFVADIIRQKLIFVHKYKHAIRQADKDYIISVSDDLHDWLLKKINLSFGSPGIENLDVIKRMFLVLMVPVIQKLLQISLL